MDPHDFTARIPGANDTVAICAVCAYPKSAHIHLTADPGFAILDGMDAAIAAAAGVKQKCVERGFTAESAETVAVELLLGLLRLGAARATPRPQRSLWDRLRAPDGAV